MKSLPITHIMVCLCTLLALNNGLSIAGDKKIPKKKIPAAVLAAFQKSYPDAKIKGQSVETEKGVKYIELESVDGNIDRDLLYTADGKVCEIEEKMDLNSLPVELKKTIGDEYTHGNIMKAEKVTRDTITTYEIQVKVGKKLKGITLDVSGKIIRTNELKGEKNEKEEESEED